MKKQLGLSLVELMISIALGLVLMAGVIQIFISTKSSFAVQQGMSRIQETGRLAMEFIGRDLRSASLMGCVRTIVPNKGSPNIQDSPATDLGGLNNNYLVGLMGYDTPGDLYIVVPQADSIGSMNPSADSNIMVIRGATERGFPVSASNLGTPSSLQVYVESATLVNNCIDGLCVNGAAVVSDCKGGRIFKASALAQAGQNLVITHGGNWDTSVLQNVFEQRPEVFVYPLHTIVYFVAPSASANNEPALWQKIDLQPAQELILGLERIRFTYRVPGRGYLNANAVTAVDWPSVDAVRVEFVVRGQEENALESVQSYLFPGDAAATTPTDRRVRQMFNSTFLIRTRNNQL